MNNIAFDINVKQCTRFSQADPKFDLGKRRSTLNFHNCALAKVMDGGEQLF